MFWPRELATFRNNEIWIDCYELVKFLRMNQSQVAKVEGTKEWERVYDQREPEG